MGAPIANSYWLPGGRVAAGEYPGAIDPAEARAKIGALLDAGITVFVDLTTPADRMVPYDPILAEEARRRGVTATRVSFPIPDMDVAPPERMHALLDVIDEQVAHGRQPYVHCWGGVGRTGIVVGCHLVRKGLSGSDALQRVASLFATMSPEKVRHHAGTSPQTEMQRSLVRGWSRHEKSRVASRLRRDRYLGAMLGLAAGDALGTTLEFRAPGTFTPIADMVGGGPFGLDPGQWTDDTSMALCLAESLLACDGFDAADQMRRYVRWWKEGHWSSTGHCFDIGNTVRAALSRFERTHEPVSGSTADDAAGNGSLMRLAPVVLRFARDPERAIHLAGESSRTTHGAPAAVDACRYFAALLVGALAGEDREVLLAPGYTPVEGLWSRAPLHPAIAAVAAGSFRTKAPPAIRGTGYVVESLEAALWAFASASDFRSGALAAVNLGNDADTTGAVYGQLAGACFGAQGIPEAWRQRLAMHDAIAAFAGRLHRAAE